MAFDPFELDTQSGIGIVSSSGGGDRVGDTRFFENDPGIKWIRSDGRPYSTAIAASLLGSIPPNLAPPIQLTGQVGGLDATPLALLATTSDPTISLAHLISSASAGEIYNTGSSQGTVRTFTAVGTGISRFRVVNNAYFAMLDGIQRISRSATGVGNTWTTYTLPYNNGSGNSRDIVFGNGVYVCCGDAGNLYTSLNGIDWVFRTNPAGSNNLNGLAFGNGMFVVVGQNIIMSSPDGITWTTRLQPAGGSVYNGVAFGNGRFVTIGGGAITFNNSTSFDGIAWTPGNELINNTNYANIKFNAGLFLACKGGSRVSLSIDGKTWVVGPSVTFSNYNYVADADIASDGTFMSYAYSAGAQTVIFFKGSVYSTPVIGSGLITNGKTLTAYMRIAL